MKLLFDQNISFRVVNQLSNLGIEIKHVRDYNLQDATDRQIWNFAKSNEFDIVTYDSDFYDLATIFGHPPKIIWIRIGNNSLKNQVYIFSKNIDTIKDFINNIENQDFACLEIRQ